MNKKQKKVSFISNLVFRSLRGKYYDPEELEKLKVGFLLKIRKLLVNHPVYKK